MRLEYNSHENMFFWVGGFDTKDIPKLAKLKWNVESRRWETSDWIIAKRLIVYASDDASREISNKEAAAHITVEMSSQNEPTDMTDIEVPVRDGLSLYNFQIVGVNYILKNRDVILADEAGLGKTLQAIGVMNVLRPKRTVIVCPSLVKYNWMKEIKKWTTLGDLRISVISSTSKKPTDADVYIINYDLLYRPGLEWLLKLSDVFLVADEAHKLKNNKSLTTKAFKKLRKNATKLLLMTGTPMLNRPIELYPLLTMVNCKIPYRDYIYRYCNATEGPFGIDVKGASNLGELQYIIRNGFYIRRTKLNVLPELPKKIRHVIYLDPSSDKTFVSYGFAERSAFGDVYDSTSTSDILNVIGSTGGGDISKIATDRKKLGLAKLPYMYDILDDALTVKDKIVVFCHHVAVAEGIVNHYGVGQCCLIHGAISSEDRFNAVHAFQTDPTKRLFVGTIDAAGVGITLTASDTLYFVEMGWVPGLMTQAEDRINRIGATDVSNIHYVVVDGTIDAKIAETLADKSEHISKLEDVAHMVKPSSAPVVSIRDVVVTDGDVFSFMEKFMSKCGVTELIVNENFGNTTEDLDLIEFCKKTMDSNYIYTDHETKFARTVLSYIKGRI